MTNPFYIDVGFSKTEIAEVPKAFGLVALLAGLVVGGAMMRRIGLMWSLLICVVLPEASNMVFALHAVVELGRVSGGARACQSVQLSVLCEALKNENRSCK